MSVGVDRDAAWERCERAAARLAPADKWRTRLAMALHAALPGPNLSLVVTCPLDQVGTVNVAGAPHDERFATLAPGMMARMEALGWDWRVPHRRFGAVYPALEHMPAESHATLRGTLAALGMTSSVNALLVTSDERCAGWLALSTRVPEGELIARDGARLARVARLAAATIERALKLAGDAGASLPRAGASPVPAVLAAREAEVARLVAAGMSDLAIASRLGIAEATVGTHVHRIYRKLGVHSRVELSQLLGASH
jgi:DNA-binding CsgD family transcriptional regulator